MSPHRQGLTLFRAVQVSMGTVSWPHGQDFCPDTLYEDGVPVEEWFEDLVAAGEQ